MAHDVEAHRDLLLDGLDVAYDTDRAILTHQVTKGVEGDIEGLVVEVAESLIDEDRVEFDPAGLSLDDIGKPERQRQRGEEPLPAR